VKTKKTGESGVENGKEKKTRDIQMAKALGGLNGIWGLKGPHRHAMWFV
jgi:hypothetical protein